MDKATIDKLTNVIDEANKLAAVITWAQRNKTVFFTAPATGSKATKPFKYEDARISHLLYYHDSDCLRSSDDPRLPLRGLRLEKSKIEDLLKKDEVTELFLMFGKAPDQDHAVKYPDDPTKFKDEFTVMVLGLDINGDFYKVGGKPVVFEYLSPCPSNCPRFIDDEFPV